ncbi:MAG: TatD family hydrolase [Muribaculaceae bacterium]|nr:TatD family hydrolase [Muribaculaceae bacterium]
MKILDIHTHHPAPQPCGVVSLRLKSDETPELMPGQCYSIGIHPWDTTAEPQLQLWHNLEKIAANPQVVAIGESGLDLTPRGGLLFRQIQIFKRHIEISEQLSKPLVIHAVKADEVLLGLHKELKPKQPWIIHGFRRKPTVATQLLRSGFYLSIGPEFNPESVKMIPAERIFAETDDSPLSIDAIIEKIASVREVETETLRQQLSHNFEAIRK